MIDSDVLYYSIVFLTIAPISIFISWKYRSNGHKSANKINFLISGLFTLLNLNILYFLVNAVMESNSYGFRANYYLNPVGKQINKMDYTPIHVSGYLFSNNEYTADVSCDKILYDVDSCIQVTESIDFNKPDDLKTFRNQLNLLREKNSVYDLFFQDKEEEEEESILENNWYKFCGAAVWLPKYGVYFMVNRVAYSPIRYRNHPVISNLGGQVFDKNWKEITGIKFPFSDLEFPTILPHNIDTGVNKKQELLGSEDPRVTLHEYTKDDGVVIQEPVIIFNALNQEVGWKRVMHIYRPLHDSHKVIRLSIDGLTPRGKEKNWMPFEAKDNHIKFVYSFPLRVIKCSLETGRCKKISGPDFEDASKSNAGLLRGGANLWEIPSKYVPLNLKDRKFWFGIARSHIDHCGCVRELYRPHAIIISRNETAGDEKYSLNYVSNLFDFNMNPEPWSVGKSTCSDGKSVLIPNSVTYFDGDYFGVTLSEADKTNKLVHTKGWSAYIQSILHESITLFDKNRDLDIDGEVLSRCSTFLSDNYCSTTRISKSWDIVFSKPPADN